jgi:hypothetical protein
MNRKQTHLDWAFGLAWLVTCAIGVTVGGMIGFVSMWSVGELVDQALGETAASLAAGGLLGAFFGLGAAIGPGLLLQRKGVGVARWLAASVIAGTLGTAIGFALAFGLFSDEGTISDLAGGLFIGLSLGLSLGVGQWLVLRQKGLSADAWPLITGFALAFLIGMPLGGEGREWLALVVIGLVLGGLTGLSMMWLLRRPKALAT